MGMNGVAGQSINYLRLPLRRIVKRWTEANDPRWPVQMIELECGHRDYWRGQKSKVRCGFCGPVNPSER